MTTPRDDGRYEAPLRPLAGVDSSARRARIVAVTITAAVGAALGLAIVSREPAPSNRAVAGLASPPPSRGTGSAQPSPATALPTANRSEHLLDLPNVALAGAPGARLIERSGLDLTIVGWTPGDELITLRTVPDAIVDPDAGVVFPILAPDGRRIVVLTAASPGPPDDGGDHARLLSLSGSVLWEADGLSAGSGALWSADGKTAVMAGSTRRWHVVTAGAADHATDRIVRLPDEVYRRSTDAVGTPAPTTVEPRTVPLGFSADGRWIYGGVVSPQLGMLVGEFRVATGSDRVEPVANLRVGKPDGLVPQPGTLGGRLVDPRSGRIADWRINSDTTSGPPTIDVRGPDHGFLFAIEDSTPIGSDWGDDGGLYVLTADALLFPDRTTLTRFRPDGSAGQPIIETGPVGGAGLIGVRDGFAGIVNVVNRPTPGAQLVLVDVRDPARATAIPLPADRLATILAAGLVP